MPIPRIILDTNCAVAGFLWGGAPAEVVRQADRRRVQLVTCAAARSEFQRVIRYPRLLKRVVARYTHPSALDRDFDLLCAFEPDPPELVREPPIVEDDPDDDLFFLLAEAVGIRYVLSRDRHLLDVGSYAGVQAVTPGDFVQALRQVTEGRPPGQRTWQSLRRWPLWTSR